MTNVKIRNVANKGIYESYMGILRISPSEDGTDSMTNAFRNPFIKNPSNGTIEQRKIRLSDSDSIQLGMFFTAYVRDTKVIDANGAETTAKVVNVSTNVDENVFVVKDYHVRSTLEVNRKNQTDRIAPIQTYHDSQYYTDTNDVLGYPVDSPCDETYFNVGNRVNLIHYENVTKDHPLDQVLKEELFTRSREWYEKNVPERDRVKINGHYIYTRNNKNEQVPIVYTREYILGHYNGHTAYINDNIKNKYLGPDVVQNNNVNDKSAFTKLSFLPLDESIWKIVEEALQGYTRHTEGRFTQLGINRNETISPRLFGTINPPSRTSYMLGLSMPHGIIMYHAMPFRRWMFHALRQQLNNARDENNDYKHVDADPRFDTGLKRAFRNGKITPCNKSDPGFINILSREFVLCDGCELNYLNYPNANVYNENMYQMENGNPKRVDGIPQVRTSFEGVYNAIYQSYSYLIPNPQKPGELMKDPNKKFIVPSLLSVTRDLKTSGRYLRGLNWYREDGVDRPLDLKEDGFVDGTYKENTYVFEVVPNAENADTEKNHSNPGPGRFSIDWKASLKRHYHYCFAATEDYNRSNSTDEKDWKRGRSVDDSITVDLLDGNASSESAKLTYPCYPNGWSTDTTMEPFRSFTQPHLVWNKELLSNKPPDVEDDSDPTEDSWPPTFDGFAQDDLPEVSTQEDPDAWQDELPMNLWEDWKKYAADHGKTNQSLQDFMTEKGLDFGAKGGCVSYDYSKFEGASGYVPSDPEMYHYGFDIDDEFDKRIKQQDRQYIYSYNVGKHGGHSDWYRRLTRPSTWSVEAGMGMKDATKLLEYSFVNRQNYLPNTFGGHTPVPCAGVFAWKIDEKTGNMTGGIDMKDGKWTIPNENETPISENDAERRKQLATMNYAEGAYPIAARGGCKRVLITHDGSCKNRHVSHGQLHYYHHNFGGYGDENDENWGVCAPASGGYEFGKEPTEELIDHHIPRCVTSLPINNIIGKANGEEEAETGHFGDDEVEFLDSLSNPPTMMFLPLFKL